MRFLKGSKSVSKMSCNGCRILRKGCSEDCMLRDCLVWIENPEGQAHATLFVAKFFGRATLMSLLSSIPSNQRSALFQSLLYEAVGRTINPVTGAVGLLWTGNWHLCQMGVEKVLRGAAAALTSHLQLMLGVGHETQIMCLCQCHHPNKPSQESHTFTFRTTPQDSSSQTQTNLLTLFF